MKLIYRILLYFFCIIIVYIPIGSASTSTATEDFETLEKNYVQIELLNEDRNDFSIIKTFEKLTKNIQNHYHSLLSWSLHSRDEDLLIENYNRKLKFGRWINDSDNNNCFDTRALVLIRDSDKEVLFKSNNRCAVESGNWKDPYTGKTFTSSKDIQIDHVVPLKNAYMSGAYKWNFKTRCLYANYLGNDFHLLSVNATENMRKGDRSPDKYMPPNPGFTCTYIKDWLSIKFLWGLKMTLAESDAIKTLVQNSNCNLDELRITDHEIQSQSEFFQSKIDLCEKLDAANKITEN